MTQLAVAMKEIITHLEKDKENIDRQTFCQHLDKAIEFLNEKLAELTPAENAQPKN